MFIQPRKSTTVAEKSPLLLDIQQGKKGVLLTVTFSGENITSERAVEAAPSGGMYSILLDGTPIMSESFTGPTLKAEKPLVLQLAGSGGEHTLRCELHSSMGKTYHAELPFLLNTTPLMVVDATEEKQTPIDPFVTLLFFNAGQEQVGLFEVAIDEKPFGIIQVHPQANGDKKNLSQWMGRSIATAELPSGNHLIKLMATGMNGEQNVQYLPFQVDNLPVLEVTKNKEGGFESLKAIFQQPDKSFAGYLDIYYQQGVIVSKQLKEPVFSLRKADITEALKQHKHSLPTEPVTMVICLRSANNTENWQHILYLP